VAKDSIQESFQAGWLCFQRASGGERLRLRLADAPPAWEQLGDERLDLLRRVAEAGAREDPDGTHLSDDDVSNENSAKGRISGPRAAIVDFEGK
jgi:hypothetical protein